MKELTKKEKRLLIKKLDDMKDEPCIVFNSIKSALKYLYKLTHTSGNAGKLIGLKKLPKTWRKIK